MSNFLEEVKDSNVELGMSDITIPFLKILQKLSPQCDEENEEFVKGAKPGAFMNSLTGKVYGKSIKVIPIYYTKNYIEWKPNRGGLVKVHDIEPDMIDKSDYSEWKLPNGNLIVETMNYYCLLADDIGSGVVVFSLTSSALKYARAWNTQINTTRLDNGNKAPFFSSVWELSTKQNKNDSGTWHTIGVNSTPAIARERFINEEEYTKFIKDTVADVGELTKKIDYGQSENRQLTAPSTDVEY